MITFGIITKLNSEKDKEPLEKLISSIKRENIPDSEIIVVGNYENNEIKCINFCETNISYITKKQNLIIDNAKNDILVFLRDYHILWENWWKGLLKFGNDWNVLMNPILNQDNTRFRDVCIWDKPGVGNVWVQREPWCKEGRVTMGGPHLPPYSNLEPEYCYINGGYFIARKWFMGRHRWNEELQWGEAEDVDLSLRMRWDKDFKYRFNPYCIVQCQKQKERILPVIPNEYFGSYEYCTEKYFAKR